MWSPSQSSLYSIPGFRSELALADTVKKVLTEFVQRGAFPVANGNDDPEEHCFIKEDGALGIHSLEVDELHDAGYVECVSRSNGLSKWVLTAGALASLRLEDMYLAAS